MNYTSTLLVLFACIFGSSNPAQAQITITQSDLLGMRGNSYQIEQTADESITVNVGSPGANQTWDLSNIAFSDTLKYEQSYLDPATTPYDTAFPQANFVIKLAQADSNFSIEFLDYFLVESPILFELGSVENYSGQNDTTIIEKYRDTSAFIPLAYNDSWTVTRSDTTDVGGGITFIYYDTLVVSVDGWGMVQIPAGDYPCLRLQELNYSTLVTFNNGVPVISQPENSIDYIWLSNEHFIIASISSEIGEADPNFTTASGMSRFTSINPGTGLKDRIQSAAFSTPSVNPNPVTDDSFINFNLKKPVAVTVRIQNLQGQDVAILLEEQLAAGDHMIAWNGADTKGSLLSDGMYLCTLTAEGISISQKIVLQR